MKKISNTKKLLENAELVAADAYETKIWRQGKHQYAVTMDQREDPIYAFKSRSFTRFLTMLELEIIYISVTKSICQTEASAKPTWEIRLMIQGGVIYYIGSNGVIVKVTQVEV
ncbi:MAG: hypothetical protein ACSHX8_08595 [Opitutaceae bacterium]